MSSSSMDIACTPLALFGSHETVRWRKGDSNSWSHRKRDAVPITTSPAKCDNVRRAVSFATFQTTTYRSGGSLKLAARRIRIQAGPRARHMGLELLPGAELQTVRRSRGC